MDVSKNQSLFPMTTILVQKSCSCLRKTSALWKSELSLNVQLFVKQCYLSPVDLEMETSLTSKHF